MSRIRRHFSPEQKADVVRRHLAGKEAVSDLADQLAIQPTQIHLWVKQLLDQAERAYQAPATRRSTVSQEQERLAALQAALARKDELLGELLHQFARRLVAHGPSAA